MGYRSKICLFAKWLVPFLAAVFLLFGTESGSDTREVKADSVFAEQVEVWL